MSKERQSQLIEVLNTRFRKRSTVTMPKEEYDEMKYELAYFMQSAEEFKQFVDESEGKKFKMPSTETFFYLHNYKVINPDEATKKILKLIDEMADSKKAVFERLKMEEDESQKWKNRAVVFAVASTILTATIITIFVR